MRIKTANLSEVALDWVVGRIEYPCLAKEEPCPRHYWNPSKDWSQGGPIIEREEIEIRPSQDCGPWLASDSVFIFQGKTPLEAAMRCFVALKLGDEVEIPKELLNG
jgi:hypothetical protein